MNHALLVLTIVPANKLSKAEEIGEKRHIVSEALNQIAPGLPAVSKIARTRTLFTEPTTAEFLAEQSNDQLCRQLALTVGTPGFRLFLQSQWI